MFVLHVPFQVEFFKLGKSTEAQQTYDFPAEIVAEVSFRPNSLEGPTIIDPCGDPLKM